MLSQSSKLSQADKIYPIAKANGAFVIFHKLFKNV